MGDDPMFIERSPALRRRYHEATVNNLALPYGVRGDCDLRVANSSTRYPVE